MHFVGGIITSTLEYTKLLYSFLFSLFTSNQMHINYGYHVGQWVLQLKNMNCKLKTEYNICLHMAGTITIHLLYVVDIFSSSDNLVHNLPSRPCAEQGRICQHELCIRCLEEVHTIIPNKWLKSGKCKRQCIGNERFIRVLLRAEEEEESLDYHSTLAIGHMFSHCQHRLDGEVYLTSWSELWILCC